MISKIIGISALAGIRARALTAAVTIALCAAGTSRAAAAGDPADADASAAASAQSDASSMSCDWVGTWATALTTASPFDTNRSQTGFENESIRMIVQTSIGGGLVRIRLSNVYGDRPLTIGHATVARPTAAATGDVDPRTVRPLTFRGLPTVTVAAGSEMVSDPVLLSVQPLGQLAVTVYLPQATGPVSWHWFARQAAFIYAGDHAANPGGGGASMTINSFYFLAGVEVPDDHRADGAVVVLGDSISDGPFQALNANTRWPDFLAQRLTRQHHRTRELGVLNLALSGNASGHDGDEVGLPELGPSGLNRLGEHVFTQPGVRTVIVQLGINDIFQHDDGPDAIIAALQQIAADLHQRHLRVLLSTIVPATGDPSWTAVREATRQAVNRYVRTTGDSDGVVDLDLAVRDPANPAQLNPAFDGGDHVHPTAAGNRAIAEIVPLSQL